MKQAGFKFEEHTADVKVRCWGKDLEEAFAQAAYALMETITPNLNKIFKVKSKSIKIVSEDREALLFDFLSELLYIFDVERLLFSQIKLKFIKKVEDQFELEANLKGEIFNKEKHEIGTEVKAITYSYMNIEIRNNNVEIQVIFDI